MVWHLESEQKKKDEKKKSRNTQTTDTIAQFTRECLINDDSRQSYKIDVFFLFQNVCEVKTNSWKVNLYAII